MYAVLYCISVAIELYHIAFKSLEKRLLSCVSTVC